MVRACEKTFKGFTYSCEATNLYRVRFATGSYVNLLALLYWTFSKNVQKETFTVEKVTYFSSMRRFFTCLTYYIQYNKHFFL